MKQRLITKKLPLSLAPARAGERPRRQPLNVIRDWAPIKMGRDTVPEEGRRISGVITAVNLPVFREKVKRWLAQNRETEPLFPDGKKLCLTRT